MPGWDALSTLPRCREDGDVTARLSPQVPFLQVKGPLLVVQLLETMLLCLVNYARWGTRSALVPQLPGSTSTESRGGPNL